MSMSLNNRLRNNGNCQRPMLAAVLLWLFTAMDAVAGNAPDKLPATDMQAEPAEKPGYEQCIQEQLEDGDPTMTLGEVRSLCLQNNGITVDRKLSAARERLAMERRTEWNPFVITPHRLNYFLPYTYASGLSEEPYGGVFEGEELKNQEAKLQISMKVPLNYGDLLFKNDAVYFAFTMKALWQVYNRSISAPFRETNYRPELFYMVTLPDQWKDADSALAIGIEHESNGRSELLSRSWNRVFINYYYAKDNYLISFRPWYRIPEEEKDEPGDAKGDDNPDIHDYMGYFELMGTWEQNDYEFSLMLRNNLDSPNRGAVRLDASFPLWGRVRGMLQYFNGYGETLIDYNYSVERIGIGILLTDIL